MGLLSILVGVPAFLWRATGTPGLNGLPDLQGIRRAIDLRWVPLEWAILILVFMAWALWAYLALAVLVRLAGHAERRVRSTERIWAASEAFTWAPLKLVVDLTLGAALITSTLGHSSGRTASSRDTGWSAVIAPQVAAFRAEATATTQSNGSTDATRRQSQRPATSEEKKGPSIRTGRSYIVRPGDSLWSIAEAKLEDPYRWTEIWRLNRRREMPDGMRLLQPGYIRPGWILRLPAPEQSRKHERSDRDEKCQSTPATTDNGARPIRKSSPSASSSSPVVGSERIPPNQDHSRDAGRRVELPSGTAVAFGFVSGFLSAIALRELLKRRTRLPQPLRRGWPSSGGEQSLKARLVGAIARNRDVIDAATIDAIEQAKPLPAQVILGHRQGVPVATNQRGALYVFTGAKTEVMPYLRDLALHTVVSHEADIEVWTNDDLGMGGIKGLRTFGDARSLVSELEIEILKRHRMFDEEELESWDSHQEAWPDDPLPLVMAISASDMEPLHNRLAAVSTQGQDLGLLVFGYGFGAEGIRVESHTLLPEGEARDFLGEPFDGVHFHESDREELLHRLTREDVSTDLNQETQTAPEVRSDAEPAIRIKLFGPPEISGASDDGTDGFGPKSRELLFFYLLHPEGASREQAVEALWPETDPEEGVNRFKFQLHLIRKHLRSDRSPTAKFIELIGDIYRPSPDLFDVDVWEFDRLISQAVDSKDDRTLTAATDLYRGELLQGVYYSWAETIQSHFRSRFLDASVQLSDLHANNGDLETAVSGLQRAIHVDPYAEHLYRTLMELYARLGRPADIHRTYRELEAALAEGIEVEPDAETEALKNRLLASHTDLHK